MGRLVALSGFMGSGKSAVGKGLADRLRWQFVDLDSEAVRAIGTDIAEYFATHGEEEFRARENEVLTAVLASLDQRGDVVLALGGGTLETAGAGDRVRQRGTVALLDVEPDVAWSRAEGRSRPLARDRDAFAALYARRRATYEAVADWIVPVEGKGIDALVSELEELVRVDMSRDGDLWARRLSGTQRSCLIVGGLGALGALETRAAKAVRDGSRPFVVTDENVDRAWGQEVYAALGGIDRRRVCVLQPGEDAKSPDNLARCWTWLAEGGARRDDVVVALGGGVVGDLAGFAAATYHRGVALWQVPTTLLAQVDSSVGGKTAINLPQGKNLVGAFYQADLVVMDPATLQTLPPGEFAGGLGEVVKHSLLMSADALGWLEQNATGLRARDLAVVDKVVKANVGYKAGVVQSDERESGRRTVLNLGHTTAHAIESTLGYGAVSHGQAVALGLLAALAVSETLLGLDTSVTRRAGALLSELGLQTKMTLPGTDALWSATKHDKKVRSGSTGFVGLKALGEPVWGLDVDEGVFAKAIEVIRA